MSSTRLTASAESASARSDLAYRLLVDVGVMSGFIYACQGDRYLYANSNTYSPVGIFGSVSPIQEETDVFPRTVTLKLAAVDSATLFSAAQESRFGRPVRIYRSFVDPDNLSSFASTPELVWVGLTSELLLNLDDRELGPHYELIAETTMRRTAPAAYFNSETQRLLVDSSDTFFDQVPNIPGLVSMWGQQASTGGSASPGGGRVTYPSYNQD